MSKSSSVTIALPETPKKPSTAVLALMALGIVFGDIGTSPLYALRECFVGPTGLTLTTGNVFGVVSVMIWTLVLIVCVKYVIFVMRADNRGDQRKELSTIHTTN
jgi:KUP system potassium uptake protein